EEVIGQTVRINGQPVTVLGVAERDFMGATPMLAVADVWIATTAHPRIAPELQGGVLRARGVNTFQMIGRLKPGVTSASAEVALDTLVRRIEEINSDPDR